MARVTDGVIDAWALDIAQAIDSYTEVSPSGTGLRIITRAKLPHRGRKRGNVECYETGRYLTITGHRVPGAPATIERRQEQVEAFHTAYFPARPDVSKPSTNGSRPHLTDSEILDFIRGSKQAAKFNALYRGDDSIHNGDTSVADLAFVSQLAFYTRDEAQLDRLFQGSGRMRDKWTSKRGDTTYGRMTIAQALSTVTQTDTPPTERPKLAGLPHEPPPPLEQRRRVRLTPASQITPKPVRWTWAGRLPVGELRLTPGRGGIGKSTFHAWIIARLTRGDLPGVHLGAPKACIVAAVEDSWERTIVPRLIAAGAKLDRVFRADVVTEDGEQMTLMLPADSGSLEAVIVDVGAALLSVDPLMSVVAVGLDTHKDRDVRQALEPLSQLADRTSVTILGNAHFRKGIAADPLMMAMGSAAFGNVVRAALGFARDVDDEGTPLDDGACVITQIKNNLGRTDLPSLRYRIDSTIIDTVEGPADVGRMTMLGETDRTVDAIFTTNGVGKRKDGSALEAAVDWLTDVLTGVGPDGMLRAEVIKLGKAEGRTERTLERASEQLGVISKRDESARGRPSTWFHPDYPPGDHRGERLADKEKPADQRKHPPAFDYPPRADGGGKPVNQRELAECHICRNGPTLVRDDQGRPAHPSCVEVTAA